MPTRILMLPAWSVFALIIVCGTASARENEAAIEVLNQSPIGRNACGPCAVINSLQLAKRTHLLSKLKGSTPLDKARDLISRYGSADSVQYGKRRTAYSEANGTSDKDLHVMLDQFLKDCQVSPLNGRHIVANETSEVELISAFREMVALSIDQGFHPLMSIRALSANLTEGEEKHTWNSLGGHWVAIHAIGKISSEGLSVPIEFSDSLSGELQTGLVVYNTSRLAEVPIQFTVDEQGSTNWTWVSNQKTLELVSPGMPIGTKRAKWHERTFIAIRYLIFRSGETAH